MKQNFVKTPVRKIEVNKFPLAEGYKCDMNIALVEGTKGFIVTENDMVHCVFKSGDEKIKLHVGKEETFCMGYTIEVSINDLKEFLGEPVDLKKWIHYFGVKTRVHTNYKLFQKSCKEIGAFPVFPEWNR